MRNLLGRLFWIALVALGFAHDATITMPRYYIVNRQGDTFNLSLSKNGVPITMGDPYFSNPFAPLGPFDLVESK